MTISPNKWELDVQGYLNTCNISDSTPRQQIRDFAKGVNDLGLWNSMVCWPLRSSQNYGSGTTAFSLGGLGAFNGTLTNGPTWAVDGSGVTLDGTNDYIEFANPLKSTALSAYSIFAIFDSNQSTSRTVIGSQGGSGLRGITMNAGGSLQGINAAGLYHDSSSDGTTFVGVGNGPGRYYSNGNTGSWQMAFAGATSSEVAISYNTEARTTQAVASTTWNDNANVRIGARIDNANYFLGPIALCLMSNSYFTAQQTSDFYTLYKTTLGQGLGLP